MYSVERIPSASAKLRSTFAGALVAIGALVAVAVAILFIVIPAHGHTTNATGPTIRSQPYAPLIRYRGTGQPPAAAATHATPGAQPTTGLLRAEHSYGAVP